MDDLYNWMFLVHYPVRCNSAALGSKISAQMSLWYRDRVWGIFQWRHPTMVIGSWLVPTECHLISLQTPSPIHEQERKALVDQLCRAKGITRLGKDKLIFKPGVGLERVLEVGMVLLGLVFTLVWEWVYSAQNVPVSILLLFVISFCILLFLRLGTANHYCIDLSAKRLRYHMNVLGQKSSRPPVPFHDLYCVALQTLYSPKATFG